jgi:hypothetical protein
LISGDVGPALTGIAGDKVARALKLIAQHPSVSAVSNPVIDTATGATAVDVTFRVNLPSSWAASGVSPHGIRTEEQVLFEFFPEFPLRPPRLSLRPDFDRNLPHLQPWLVGDRPVPCIYDGPLSELLHQEGLHGLLNQTTVWLDRAALGQLIDPEQGWEPARRDELDDFLVADAGILRSQVTRYGGYRFFDLQYLRITKATGPSRVRGEIANTRAHPTPENAPTIFEERAANTLVIGRSVALLVWPGKRPSGEPFIADRYAPETVKTIQGLTARAGDYGCAQPLDSAFTWLRRCVERYPEQGPFVLAVVLVARRPFDVQGAGSPLELFAYVTDIYSPSLFREGTATEVRPAGHRHKIAQPLLRRLAGHDAEAPSWMLLGCGSLGSKIGMHLTRSGCAPAAVVDKGAMSPHNAARHALLPPTGDLQLTWTDAKARLLANAMRGFGAEATPVIADAVDLCATAGGAREAWFRRKWAVINATGSLNVREALAAARDRLPTRVIECSLLSSGRIGLLTVEGADRNPDTGDLISLAYRLMKDDPGVASVVYGSATSARREITGEGCGSLTMRMSDGRLSLFAASMAEAIAELQRSGLPETFGVIMIGRLGEDHLGLTWSRYKVAPALRVSPAGSGEWRVSIQAATTEKIESEVVRWPNVETGGVIVGRLSEAANTFYVVDVLAAPPDSTRAAGEFVLGVQGLQRDITAFAESTGWSLYCLGTWHSHLKGVGPSGLDHATARAVSLARVVPSVLLIHTPSGYHAILAASP